MKKNLLPIFGFCLLLSGVSLFAQQDDLSVKSRSFVSADPVSAVVVAPGHSTPISFTFHVLPPYHINSNKPLAEELIPTQVHFSLPGSDIVIGKIQYPAGVLKSFPFDPTAKLSVYSGDVVVRGLVVATASGSTGTYTVHAELKYQACDNNACYPPKKLPFTFNVKVGAKARSGKKARPNAQSPHIH
ncbi:MAG: disulfide bond formation protein DsbC [Acidobacteriia bacterium]|nr:disulfide bond formation protein DsbC [Terriglobia bacterium]